MFVFAVRQVRSLAGNAFITMNLHTSQISAATHTAQTQVQVTNRIPARSLFSTSCKRIRSTIRHNQGTQQQYNTQLHNVHAHPRSCCSCMWLACKGPSPNRPHHLIRAVSDINARTNKAAMLIQADRHSLAHAPPRAGSCVTCVIAVRAPVQARAASTLFKQTVRPYTVPNAPFPKPKPARCAQT